MALSTEQQQIADSANDLLKRQAHAQAVRAAIASGGFDRALWQQVGELGWCGVHLPEDLGGLGLGLSELCVLAEALGAHLAPVPWFETAVLAGQVLALADYPGDEIDDLLFAAGEAIWRAGPLAKGSNLCHGTAGTGYAFLKLYRRTGDGWSHGRLAP